MASTTYQIVPYLLSVGVKGSSTETRPIWDINGKQATLLDAVAKTVAASRGRQFPDQTTPERKLEVAALQVGDHALYMRWQPGRSGIESEIRRPDGETVSRSTKDTEYVPVRHVLICPPGSAFALLFAERVGQVGAVTMTTRLLQGTFQKYNGDLRLRAAPAVTSEVMHKMIADQPIKGLVFKRPRTGDAEGHMINVSGEPVHFRVELSPRRRHFWKIDKLPKETASQEVTTASLLGVLAPVLRPGVDHEQAVASLLEEGWQSALSVKFPNGSQREVNMTESHATTMSFPIVDSADDIGERPTDEQFRQACEDALGLFEGQYGIGSDAPKLCQWTDDEWQDPGTPWEVQWEV